MTKPYVILNISPGTIRSETALCFIHAAQAGVDIVMNPSCTYLDVGRNLTLQACFQDPDLFAHEWLIFIDSDIDFTVSDLDNLIVVPDDVHLVSGVYASSVAGYGFVDIAYWIKYLDPEDPEYKIHEWKTVPYTDTELRALDDAFDDYPGLKRVDGCGAGFLAIRTSLVREMLDRYGGAMPWFHCLVVACGEDKEQWVGEDFGFCFRAHAIGYDTYINTNVNLGHYKTLKVLPEHVFRDLDLPSPPAEPVRNF